jgi:hypothetical protein
LLVKNQYSMTMKRCYCGQENEDSATCCIQCGGQEFMGQQKKVEPVVSPEAPSKLQKREKKEGGALVVHGAFRLRRKKAGDDLAYKSVASSLGGCKVGILEIGRQHMVLKQRLTRAGGFLLAASSFLMVPLLAASDNASSSLEGALAVLMMVFLAGTIVVPVMSGTIVHLDADAFFASFEQSADVRLRGKPIAAGGETGTVVCRSATADKSWPWPIRVRGKSTTADWLRTIHDRCHCLFMAK